MSEIENRALPIPPALLEEPLNEGTHEMIRAWWDGTRPRMMIRSTFNDYANVGSLLAELSWHFAQAYSQRLGVDRAEVMNDIRDRWLEQQATYDRTDPGLTTRVLDNEASSS